MTTLRSVKPAHRPYIFGQNMILDSHSFLISYTDFFQFDSAAEGTPVKNSGFCGQWSLKNAAVLFKDSYKKESGGSYGLISLDKHSTVKHTAYFYIVVYFVHFFIYSPQLKTAYWKCQDASIHMI